MKKTILIFFVAITLIAGYVFYVSSAPLFSSPDGTLILAVALGDTEYNGDDWLEIQDPSESQLGDTFIGSSEIEYKLVGYTYASGEKQYEEEIIGITTIGIWVVIDRDYIDYLENMMYPYEMASSLFTSDWVFADDVKEVDQDSIPVASDSNVGDQFIGPSGATYVLESFATKEQQVFDDAGIMIVGEWKLVPEDC